MTPTPTPRPWTVKKHHGEDNFYFCIHSESRPHKSNVVLTIRPNQDNEAEANAALIVRAVNAHDALVEALQAFLRCEDASDANRGDRWMATPLDQAGRGRTD